MILVYAYTGFEGGLVVAGEMKNPSKDIPFALFFALFFIAVLYMLVQIVSIGVYPDLGSSTRPLADVAEYMLGAPGGILIIVGAGLSISGTLNANALAGSRTLFAMSEEGQFPRQFAKTNLFGIPAFSLFIYLFCSLLVSVSGTFIYALSTTVIIRIIVYAFVCAIVIKLRLRKGVSITNGFKMKYGYLMAIAGILICSWLLYTSNLSDLIDVMIAILSGLILYIIFKKKMM